MIYQMKAYAIVLSSLLLLTSAQVLLGGVRSNLQIEREKVASQEDQAVGFVYAHYPQLANLSRANASNIGRRGNETSKAGNILVILSDNQTTQASAIVAFFQDGQILEASPVLLQFQPSNTSNTSTLLYNASSGRKIAYIQSGSELDFLPSEAIAPSRAFPLNSIPISVSRLSDPRLSLALALVPASHPQIAHYIADSVAYQVVSGINYFIKYRGKDEITQVRAWVFVDLDMKAHLIELEVGCLQGVLGSFNCSAELAERIFKVGESLILMYPELMNCNLLSVVSDDAQPEDGMLFVITYQSWDRSTRTMVQLNLLSSSFNLQSYYLYSSPKPT